MADEPNRREPDYRRTRIGLAAGLAGGALFQVVVQPFSQGFEPSPVVIVALLVAALGCVGVDVFNSLKGLIK